MTTVSFLRTAPAVAITLLSATLLAAVLREHGGEALLDSYDAERRRHNWRIADNALVALTLMIAESKPDEKNMMVKVVVNLINPKN